MTSSVASQDRLQRLLEFLEQDAGNLALRKDAAREALQAGDWDKARELIDAGLWLHPSEPELLALAGYAHLQAQRYEDAEQTLSAALAHGVDAPEVRYNLAFAQFMQKRHAIALELIADPSAEAVPLALFLRARCLHHLQRRQEAIAACEAYLAAAPDDAEAHGLLGLLLQEEGATDRASVHVETALRQNPQQLEAMLASACLDRERRDYEAAGRSLERLVQVYPQCGRAWHELAMMRLVHLQLDAARQAIERATAHMPEHIGTWHVLAWIEIIGGDAAAAERAFEQAMALDRNFGETHGGLAVVAVMQGRKEDARAGIKRALRLNPQSMSPRYAEILLLQSDSKHDEARAVLEKFLARPVADSDLQFRDLITLHLKYLQTRAGAAPGSRVLH